MNITNLDSIVFVPSDLELKVYLLILFETKMATDYITKGILYIFADILSLVTVALCMVQKLPQIQQIYTYKSAKGKHDHVNSLIREIFLINSFIFRPEFDFIILGAVQLHGDDAV